MEIEQIFTGGLKRSRIPGSSRNCKEKWRYWEGICRETGKIKGYLMDSM